MKLEMAPFVPAFYKPSTRKREDRKRLSVRKKTAAATTFVISVGGQKRAELVHEKYYRRSVINNVSGYAANQKRDERQIVCRIAQDQTIGVKAKRAFN